jgi:hypothetical protein
MVGRSRFWFYRSPHLIDPVAMVLQQRRIFGSPGPPWWRTHARLVTYGTAYLPRWAERRQ